MLETPDDPPFAGLVPDTILDAVDSTGVRCNGQLQALNSYENRVYQVGIEGGPPLVAKFYRPGRWSDACIGEEHSFTTELADHDLPVVPPLAGGDGATLHRFREWRVALFPRRGGRLVDLDDPARLRLLGRLLGRLHAVGATRPFRERPAIGLDSFGTAAVATVGASGYLPEELAEAYFSVTRDLLARVRECYLRAGDVKPLRLHGDCHPGNLLWTDDAVHLVDLDDCRTGPAIQDLWMLLSGSRDDMAGQLEVVLEGYRGFYDFDRRELHLVEALRSLRLLHHSAWLAERWHDPAFPAAFPWFGEARYWQDQILALREQLAAIDEGPLELGRY